MSTTVRIESESRWDALALTQRISAYRWYLIQPQHDRWWICLEFDNEEGISLSADLLERVRGWLHDRQLPAAVVHANDGDYTIQA